MALPDILDGTPVETIDQAIAVMEAIDRELPDTDGVKWFNRLYLRVTDEVEAALGGATFRDPGFIATLDVVFANLYFSALASGIASAEAAVPAIKSIYPPILTSGARLSALANLLCRSGQTLASSYTSVAACVERMMCRWCRDGVDLRWRSDGWRVGPCLALAGSRS